MNEVNVGQAASREIEDTVSPHDGRPAAARPRRYLSWTGSMTVQALATVVLAHAAALPVMALTRASALAYAMVALLFSCVGLLLLGRRWSRALTGLRLTLAAFAPSHDYAAEGPGARITGLRGLQRGFESAHRRAVRRLHRLRTARDTAEAEAITQRALVTQLARAQRIARVGSWEWDRDAGDVALSGEVQRILGFDAVTSAKPGALQALVHGEDRRAFRRWVIKLARGESVEGMDVRIRTRAGDERHVHLMGEGIRNEHGRCTAVAGTIQDSTEHTRAIQQIHRLAYFDVLTELPNRSRFYEKLAETLEAARRESRSFAIMFLDLDHFKRINDTLGHAMGDELLRIIAQRLTRSLRPDDIAGLTPTKGVDRDVCRQGGDEFIILLNGVASEQEAARAATRLLGTLAQPIMLGTQEVFVSASIGIVLFPRDGDDLDSLLKNADVAMYHAKGEGRNRFDFYRESMREYSAQRLALEHDLRKALEGGQFELYYQPQVEVRSGRIAGIEALIRWNHPTLGLLTPGHFITVAEEAGLIMDIWEWVMVTALIQHNAWQEQGLPPVTIAVNLSSVQFDDPGLAERVQASAQLVGVPLDYLELEVTESMLMHDFEATLTTLSALRSMGVRIAIDDFGTGYSSLAYLRRLPVDKLKLDQSFTRDVGGAPGDGVIIKAVLAIAQSLDLAVVAEGVETQAQIDFLVGLGCTTVQGYLLGRPLPAAETAELLRQSATHLPPPETRRGDPQWASIVRRGPAAGKSAAPEMLSGNAD
jgi:diguanylate cyclase (GGDEF)-like protein/PAS domain S-box-containing protein